MSACKVLFALINPKDIKGRLIRNPNYGGPSLSYKGWTWRPELSKHGKEGFQEALEKSIRDEGIRNPILVWNMPEGIYLTFGGSRVRAALSVGIREIPAIINDVSGDYPSKDTVTSKNLDTFFKDMPYDWEFGEDGAFDYHYNLERARRANHDPAGFYWLDGERPDWVFKEFPWLSSK